ncbi:MAG: hypothetical protein IT195_01015 [Microthrixaceae bacterium]|nr:hypothetical protein [Microthrixaceae bacterium]
MSRTLRNKWIAAISVGVIVGAGAGIGVLAGTGDEDSTVATAAAAARRPAAAAAVTSTTVPVSADAAPAPVEGAAEIAPLDPAAAAPVADAPIVAAPAATRRNGGAGSTGTSRTPNGSTATAGAATPSAATSGAAPTPVTPTPAAAPAPAVTPTPAAAPAPAVTPTPAAPAAPSAPRNARVRLGFAGTTATRGSQPLVVHVDWDAPASGSVGGYAVACRKSGTSTGGTTLAAAASARSIAFPALPVGQSHSCTVQATGPAGVSPVANATGSATPVSQPPASFSAGTCLVGSRDGIIGERYLVTGPPPLVRPAGVTASSLWAQPSLGGTASELRTPSSSPITWATLTDYPGHYERRGGSSISVWVEWTVQSAGTTYTMLSPAVTAPCS